MIAHHEAVTSSAAIFAVLYAVGVLREELGDG